MLGYSLFPQWELYKSLVIAIMHLFQNNVLKSLVLDCLDVLNLILTESLLLAIDPDVVVMMYLHRRIRNNYSSFYSIGFEYRISIATMTTTSQKCVTTVHCFPSHYDYCNQSYISCFTTAATIDN